MCPHPHQTHPRAGLRYEDTAKIRKIFGLYKEKTKIFLKKWFHKACGKEKHHHTMRSDGVYIME
jgi:hypothetical protein